MRIATLLLTLGSLVLLSVGTGCAGHTDDPQTGDDQEVKAGGKEGATCGGFAGLRCASGLECVLPGNHPDEAGTCKKAGSSAPKAGEEGATCGGIAGLTCKSGLSCKIADKATADASGTCQAPKPGEEGGMCGGFAGLPCDKGLHCVLPHGAIDAAGTCSK